MLERPFIAALVATMSLAGCDQPKSSTESAAQPVPSASPFTNPPPPSIPGWPAVKAQPKLKTMKLFVGAEEVTAELAMNQIQIATGMMFRTEMAENEGMLFIFARPHRPAFYMKNTKVPLNIAYLDEEGTILELHELQPLNETPVEAASERVQFVLEMNKGWFHRHNVAVGSLIRCEYGKLKDTFRFGP